jgi:hypothetical protein
VAQQPAQHEIEYSELGGQARYSDTGPLKAWRTASDDALATGLALQTQTERPISPGEALGRKTLLAPVTFGYHLLAPILALCEGSKEFLFQLQASLARSGEWFLEGRMP